jgi:hypothetical protein
MILPESLLVVLACTLSGGIEKRSSPAPAQNNATCGIGTRWVECGVLDASVTALHLAVPWVVTLGAVVVLSMPTVLLRSKHKEKGLSVVASNLMQCLGLMLCSSFLTDHPSICFTLSLHSCILLLGHMDVAGPQVGAGWWWACRHLVALGLLVWEALVGPAVSVVHWPSTPPGTALQCAYLAHLAGAVVPDCVLLVLRGLLHFGRCVCGKDD